MNIEFDDPLGIPDDPNRNKQFRVLFVIEEVKDFVKEKLIHSHETKGDKRYVGSTAYVQGTSVRDTALRVLGVLHNSKYIRELEK